MSEIVSAISTVGFAVVMCLLLSWYIKYVTDKQHETNEGFRHALEDNTIVITKLLERIDRLNDSLEGGDMDDS